MSREGADTTQWTETPADRGRQERGRDAQATLVRRIGAYLLDFTLLTVVAVGLSIALVFGLFYLVRDLGAVADPGTGQLIRTVLEQFILLPVWLLIGIVVFGYFTVLDATGGTIGKRLAGLVVADRDRAATPTGRTVASVGLRSAAVRTGVLMAPFPLMVLAAGLLGAGGTFLALFMMGGWLLVEALVLVVDDENRRLGDKAAGTAVVQKRT